MASSFTLVLSLSTLLRLRWIVAAGRAGEHAPAVGQFHQARVARLGSILRQHTVDGDLIAGLQRLLAPAVPRQRVRRAALTLPRLDLALVGLHLEVHPDVRVHP